MSAKQLLEGFTADLRGTIPTLERSLNDITPLIRTLIEQYGDFVKIALDVIPQVAQDVVTSQFSKGSFADWLMKQFPSMPEAEAKMLFQKFKEDPKLFPSIPTPKINAPFQGPEINPVTGEKSTFLTNLEKAKELEGAEHIPEKVMSNVSLQSLILNKKDLEFQIRRAGTNYQNALAQFNLSQGWSSATKKRNAHKIIGYQQNVGSTAVALRAWQQKYADFMKRHGHRF